MIYIVCSCDMWKMRNSMRIITATTSIAKLKQLIAQLIEDGTFGYGVAQNPDGNDAAIRFREDYNYAEAGKPLEKEPPKSRPLSRWLCSIRIRPISHRVAPKLDS